MENVKVNKNASETVNKKKVETNNSSSFIDVKLTVPLVNVRKDHSIDSEIVDVITNDRTYKVLGNKTGKPIITKGTGSNKGWMKLAPLYRRSEWISADYCETVEKE